MHEKTTAQPSRKHASQKRPARGRCAISYPDALRVVQRDAVRPRVLVRFRALGGDRERWCGSDQAAMADALTRAEDWIELEHPLWPDRAAMREVRRALEASQPERGSR